MKTNNLLPSLIFLLGAALFLASPFIENNPKEATLSQVYQDFKNAISNRDSILLNNYLLANTTFFVFSKSEINNSYRGSEFLEVLSQMDWEATDFEVTTAKLDGIFGNVESEIKNQKKCFKEYTQWIKQSNNWQLISFIRQEIECD